MLALLGILHAACMGPLRRCRLMQGMAIALLCFFFPDAYVLIECMLRCTLGKLSTLPCSHSPQTCS